MNFLPTYYRVPAPVAALLLVLALAAAAQASGGDYSQPPLRPGELLSQAVANEKAGEKDDYYAWTDRLQKPRGSVTKLMVKTPEGILARTIAYNDKPLSAVERQQDDARINPLLDASKMREKASKQQEDQRHIERLLMALPDAFLCEYSAGEHEEHTLRLNCSPNPRFSPPNYETQILQGMKAVIFIDRDDKRVARIEGTLFKDVTFGWGFLGRLNRGGHIEITQSKVAGRHWGLTRMNLVFDGRIVMIKPLHVEETELSWDYRPVPGMTVAQALQYLKSAPTQTSHTQK
jgi:hypothetical protein